MSNPETTTSQIATGLTARNAVTFRKILVPIDLSTESSIPVAVAMKIATLGSARMVLLHVIELPRTELNPAVLAAMQRMQDHISSLKESAQRNLSAFGEEIRASKIECTEEVRMGIPYEEIVHAAEENIADLVVIGHKGGSKLMRLLLGSTAERVVRLARCSVLVARP